MDKFRSTTGEQVVLELYICIVTGLQIRVCTLKLISYFSSQAYVVGTQKNRLNETVLLSTHNTQKKFMGKKIIAILGEKLSLSRVHTDKLE